MAKIKLKCESCGNEIYLDSSEFAANCEYCNNPFHIPQSEAKDDILNLYSRADNAWDHKDYDEALQIYNQIIREDDRQAKAHFCAALCRYGITYEIDPGNGRKVPTCNRFNRTSILDDKNYQTALKYAPEDVCKSYKSTGETIDRITRDFLKIVDKEEPYDVFISYKRTDKNGEITKDSEHARKLYYYLTEKKYKVFFAEKTLKNIAGENYEPYIFAALSSAPVMVLLGSSRENLKATWVQNEWKRFLNLESQGEKKTLIPCCLDMDPYDLPGELRAKQSMDAGSFTFHEDIGEVIEKKLAGKRSPKEGRSLADRYAPPEKVNRVVDELDCEKELAIEALTIQQGDISKTIAYIKKDNEYRKKLWVCAECGRKNTHDICHNDICGLSKEESVKISKKREAAKRDTAAERRARAEKLRRARPAILIASGVLALILLVFGIIGAVQVGKVNSLMEKIPKTIHDYSRFENQIMDAYTAYDKVWGMYKFLVDDSRLEGVMDGFNQYRVDSIRKALSEITVENAKSTDILTRLGKYYTQLNDTQSGMLNAEEFGKLESYNCCYETITAIDTLMNDVVANYDTLADIQNNYASLSADYQPFVHNYSKLDGIEDTYNMYSNLEFVAAGGGWAVKAKDGCAAKITGDIVIPSSYKGQEVKTIPEGAFSGCSAINSIVVPDTVTYIGDSAFSGCTGLKSITLPFVGQSRTASKGEGVFGYIFGQKEYTGGTGVEQFYTATNLYIPSQLRSVTITDATQISDRAFRHCSMLTEINLCDTIIAIGERSFSTCSGIKELYLPNITVIPNNAFIECSSLESFNISESITTISQYSFYGCSSLKRINSDEDGCFIIPDTITSIGEFAFSGCIALKSITLPFVGQSRSASKGEGVFGYIFGNESYTGGTGIEQFYTAHILYIPSQLRSVTITDATTISQEAFRNCSMLTFLQINAEAKANVGEDAFRNCISPKYV